jgi:cellulose synthase/poly-beta-1,6-N-acetylglucosamine synthase-like glycosyltransferase
VQVTEGKGSRKGHRLIVTVCAVLLAAGAAGAVACPRAAAPLLWVALVVGGGTVLRSLFLSVVVRFFRPRPAPPTEARPSIALVIPGLNEIVSLRRTVPAMMALKYDGELRFCYVLEAASTDGSADYVRARAAEDPRILPIDKSTPPGGRGAAVAYGVARAPACDVIGFLDADHEMDQAAFDELVRVFGQPDPPAAIQGICATIAGPASAFVRLLSLERSWLEAVEVEANPRLGGICLFGGGQGFFRREVVTSADHLIDEGQILDDIDLACRLALEGYAIAFDRGIVTRSTQPETLGEFADQRFRWARGWVQLASKFLRPVLSRPAVAPGARMDFLRLLVMPFAAALLFVAFGSGAALLVSCGHHGVPAWLAAFGLLWPFLTGFHPLLTWRGDIRLRDAPLLLVGVPLLFYAYMGLCAVSVVDAWVLRRPLSYAKTAKHE